MTGHTVRAASGDEIDRVRGFNRFYTRHLGALQEGLLRSPYTLVESRILYELGSRGRTTASALAADLAMDPAHLSRVLRRLREIGLAAAETSGSDGRARDLTLTAKGSRAFATLDAASMADVEAVLDALTPARRRELLAAMARVRAILDPAAPAGAVVIRPHRIGDIGRIIARHGELYAEEYGWDASFEGFAAEIAGKFLTAHDPARERCWVAERDGVMLGSVFLVDAGEGVAKLRMLFVEPDARGLGIGRKLVEECMRTARTIGYGRMRLWTNDILVSARRIYEAAGFRLVAEERHRSFGRDLVGQEWEAEL